MNYIEGINLSDRPESPIKYLHMYHIRRDQRSHFPFHRHGYYEFNFFFTGHHTFRLNDQDCSFGSGDLCLLPPGTIHACTFCDGDMSSAQEPDDGWTLNLLADFLGEDRFPANTLLKMKMGRCETVFRQTLELIYSLAHLSPRPDEVILSLVQLLVQLITDLSFERDCVSIREHSGREMQQVLLYIHQHYMENLTLDSLTQRFSFSRSNLMRLFQQTYGTTPISYRIDCQVVAASNLLHKTDYTLERIAELVGFHDVHYFSHIFSRHMKVSPSQFRRNYAFYFEDEKYPRLPKQYSGPDVEAAFGIRVP